MTVKHRRLLPTTAADDWAQGLGTGPGFVPVTGAGIRVLIVSDQPLVAESVSAALENFGFRCRTVPFRAPRRINRAPERGYVDVGLLMSDFRRDSDFRFLRAALERNPMRWLLLSGTPRGPLWGAMLERGVAAILPSSTHGEQVVLALREVAEGNDLFAPGERAELMRLWRVQRAEHDQLLARTALLTPRERAVVELLYLGESVRAIADMFEVTEATVRSQVRSVLRKLDVTSQLAAVALWSSVRDEVNMRSEADHGH